MDRVPGRLEVELEAFEELGFDFELDTILLAGQGRVVLRGSITYNEDEIELEVWYPDLFPYLRPEVVATDLRLERHQNPYEGNLCLIDRSTGEWSPRLTGAWMVARVPYLLDLLEEGGDALREAEAPQGEPISTYFRGYPGSAIFVPEEALSISPEAKLGSGRISFSIVQPPQLVVRGLLSEVVEKNHKRKVSTLARAGEGLKERFDGKTLTIRWVRLERPPEENTPAALLAAIESVQSGFGSPPWENVLGGQIGIAGAVFSEEVRQGEYEDTWVFAVRVRQEQGGGGQYLVPGARLSREDLEVRLPESTRLAEKTVSLMGLGALGSAITFELAKAGVGVLRGFDQDTVEAGTTVRWARGLDAVGHMKTQYLAGAIEVEYPFTKFEPFTHRLGESAHVLTARTETEFDVLDQFLDASDLVIDASAEIGVQHVISAEANSRSIPQLYVSATEGALGGIVARVVPGHGGCWMCLQHHLQDKTLPLPAYQETATRQPRGCASPTYTGAGYDLLPVIAQATRAGVDMLVNPDARHSDISVSSFEAENGLPPSWEHRLLDRHADCPYCSETEPT